jgi:hypothetical protein
MPCCKKVNGIYPNLLQGLMFLLNPLSQDAASCSVGSLLAIIFTGNKSKTAAWFAVELNP